MFCVQDIKPSNIVKLKSKKIEYIVTEHLELFDRSTGKIFAKLGNLFDSNNNILAVKHNNTLLKYYAFRDDKDLFYLKTVNNLLTYNEMIVELRNQDVYLGRLNVTYKKVKNEQLNLFYKTKDVKTYFGSYQSLHSYIL